MTEEQLRIARNTKAALDHAKSQYETLKIIIDKGFTGVKVSTLKTETFINQDEIFFLTDLLEYRRKELISLEKEFANL
jgi:hypothetical protein